jgi:hypothetical protein
MQSYRTYLLTVLVPILLLTLPSCDAQLRNQLDIRTNGFTNDNCFQALIVIEPDESARGLVARRESASQKAKKADLREMALECLINYSIDSQQKSGILDRNRKNFDMAAHRARLMDRLRGLARGGKTAFSYYNDSNGIVIGYTIYNIGLRKKLEDILKTPDSVNQESSKPEPRS